jgi:autotransporter-associated beta strand protein
LLCVSFFGVAAHAQDATWLVNPGSSDFNTAGNWSPATVPTDTAFFGPTSAAGSGISFSANTTIGGWTFNLGAPAYSFVNSSNTLQFTGAGIISNNGNAGVGITNNGTINFNNNSTAGSAGITNNFGGGTINFNNNSTAGNAFLRTFTGTINFNNNSTAGNAVIGNGLNEPFFPASLNFNNNSTAGNATIFNGLQDHLAFFGNSTAGNAAISSVISTTDFSGSSGPNGDHKLSAGSIAGGGSFLLGANQLTVGGNNQSTEVSGNIADGGGSGGTGGSLVKVGTGTLTLTVTNSYTGTTTVNQGTLEVDGSIARSSQTIVNNGATLLGIGTVGNTQINSGGMFAPGAVGQPATTMTVAGNLAFASGAIYLAQINPLNATSANVTAGGNATLNGTVDATFAFGGYFVRKYDILHAATMSGTFGSLNTLSLPAGFTASLTYTGTDVFLDLTATMGSSPGALGAGGLNQNQHNIANALNNFFNSGGTLPPNFLTIFGLTGPSLQTALTQLSGEASTGAEKGAFQLMTGFLSLMLDPFVDGRGGIGSGATGFAPEQAASFPPDIALAYDAILKAPPKQDFEQRWTVWGTSFGGYNKTNGDPSIGTNTVTTHDFGFAGGMDYHFSPDTLAGFSLAGGGVNWGLAQGLGGGRSDDFTAGVYAKTRSGPWYIAGALASADHWFATNRTAALGDQLTASFNGQSFGGRVETGYRYAVQPTLGVSPYAALQGQIFHTPSYSETDITAGGFGLTYNAMNATDARGELGARFDDLTVLNAMPLVLRARLAWAHDWISNPALGAVFQALPGASFIVNGAAPPKDSALASAGAELHMTTNWSLAAKFDGEFAKGSQTYAGTGTLRYTW